MAGRDRIYTFVNGFCLAGNSALAIWGGYTGNLFLIVVGTIGATVAAVGAFYEAVR